MRDTTAATGRGNGSQVFIILKGSIKLGAREREDGRTDGPRVQRRLLCPFYGALQTHSKLDLRSALGHPLRPDYAHYRRGPHPLLGYPSAPSRRNTTLPQLNIPRDTSTLFIASSRPRPTLARLPVRPSVRPSDCAKKERSAVCIWPAVANSLTLLSLLLSFRNGRKTGGYCDFIPHKRVLYD